MPLTTLRRREIEQDLAEKECDLQSVESEITALEGEADELQEEINDLRDTLEAGEEEGDESEPDPWPNPPYGAPLWQDPLLPVPHAEWVPLTEVQR